MKKTLLFVLLLGITLCAWAQTVNGEVRWFEDKKVVRVWGTHAERGYAIGYLLGEQIPTVFDDYFLDGLMSGNPAYYAQVRTIYSMYYTAEAQYVTEFEAVLQGVEDSGASIYNELLGRNLDVTDVLIVNAVIDLSALTRGFDPSHFGCASITSWAEATQDDPVLGGELVMTRFMDWSSSPSLRNNPVVIVHQPSEENEIDWACFTYPGLLGALSAVDITGRAYMLNMGNYSTLGTGSDSFYSQLLSIRTGVERYDYNEDGEHTLADVVDAVDGHRRAPGTIVMMVAPPEEEAPLVLESNDMAGISVRRLADNTEVQGTNIAATNHFRSLYAPVYCSRYSKIVDSLAASPLMTLERSPKLLEGAAAVPHNLMAIRYDTATHTVGFATTTSASDFAYEGPYTNLTMEDLFGEWTDVEGEDVPGTGALQLRSWPNPFNPSTTIAFNAAQQGQAQVRVYDIRGRLVQEVFDGTAHAGENRIAWDATGLPSGVYLARVKMAAGQQTAKLLLLE